MSKGKASPFDQRGKIEKNELFFGRKAETVAVFNWLNADKPQSISIIGEEKIGKSSFLAHIERQAPSQLNQRENYRFAYIDMRRADCHTPDQFRAVLAHELWEHTAPDGKIPPHALRSLLDDFQKTTPFHIVLLDNFQTIAHYPDLCNQEFFSALRTHSDAGEFAFLFCSRHPLIDFAEKHNIPDYLLNQYQTITLPCFSESEAREMVLRPTDYRLTDADFSTITQWVKKNGGYPPHKLNIAADLIYQARANGQNNPNYSALKERYEEAKSTKQLSFLQKAKKAINTIMKWGNQYPQIAVPALLFVVALIIVPLLFDVSPMDIFKATIIKLLEPITTIPTPTPTP